MRTSQLMNTDSFGSLRRKHAIANERQTLSCAVLSPGTLLPTGGWRATEQVGLGCRHARKPRKHGNETLPYRHCQ